MYSITADDNTVFGVPHNEEKMAEMEIAGSGRVLLSRFYLGAFNGLWDFFESVEYLAQPGRAG